MQTIVWKISKLSGLSSEYSASFMQPCGGVIIVLFLFRYMVKHDANAQPNNNLVMEIIGIAIGFISVLLSRSCFYANPLGTLRPLPSPEKSAFSGVLLLYRWLYWREPRAHQCCILLHHQKRYSFLHRTGYIVADAV